MIESLSHMHLLIATALMAATGLLSAGRAASMYFLCEQIVKRLRRRKAERLDTPKQPPRKARSRTLEAGRIS